jgi:hypothetical protein
MRSRITWVIVGAVVVIGVFAGLDALRSSGGEPPRAEAVATEAATTTQAERDTELTTPEQDRKLFRAVVARLLGRKP